MNFSFSSPTRRSGSTAARKSTTSNSTRRSFPSQVAEDGMSLNSWSLETFTYGGADYLLDKRNDKVYADYGEDEGRPLQLVGRLAQGQLLRRSERWSFFRVLDDELKANRQQLVDLFNRYDVDRSGALERHELKRLFKELLPSITVGEERYLEVMLDADGDGSVTYAELVRFLKDCKAAEAAVATPPDQNTQSWLLSTGPQLAAKRQELVSLFRKYDTNYSGHLTLLQVKRLLLKLLPKLPAEHLRQVLAHLRAHDFSGNGLYNISELEQLLGVSRPRRKGRLPTMRGENTATGTVPHRERKARASGTALNGYHEFDSSSDSDSPERSWHHSYSRSKISSRPRVHAVQNSQSRDARHQEHGRHGNPANSWTHEESGMRELSPPKPPAHDEWQFYSTLEEYLKSNESTFDRLFDRHSRLENVAQVVEHTELMRLMHALVPAPMSDAELGYVEVMLMSEPRRHFRCSDLERLFADCAAAEHVIRLRFGAAEMALVKQTAVDMEARLGAGEEIFRRTHGRGKVTAEEMLHALPRSLSPQEVRIVLAYLRAAGVGAGVHLTERHLHQALTTPAYDQKDADIQSRTSETWELCEAALPSGMTVLLDPQSGWVYEEQRGEDPPVPLGELLRGQFSAIVDDWDFFCALDGALANHPQRLREAFRRHELAGKGGSGMVERWRAGEVMLDASPRDPTPGELPYAEAMLAAWDGAEDLTWLELMALTHECRTAEASVRLHRDPELLKLLHRVGRQLAHCAPEVRRAFRSRDKRVEGFLELPQVRRVLRTVMPQLQPADGRRLLATLRAGDVRGTGLYSAGQVLRALGGVRPHIRRTTQPMIATAFHDRRQLLPHSPAWHRPPEIADAERWSEHGQVPGAPGWAEDRGAARRDARHEQYEVTRARKREWYNARTATSRVPSVPGSTRPQPPGLESDMQALASQAAAAGECLKDFT
ncbi:hypothetical protein CYMTET_5014 [Cymbomonas tetramitiformis]|uniref:EF-hand domain-containing protein n=1 Tax=Cymbomonas tetramitiformis TaxID=36881 RepID=A0AAE0H083_9CHLO|nr:hypothetical protein CYMTET_5014 [Cymbomonas tetramitiformis]